METRMPAARRLFYALGRPGVILVGPLAAVCSLLALVVYSRYPEPELLSACSACSACSADRA